MYPASGSASAVLLVANMGPFLLNLFALHNIGKEKLEEERPVFFVLMQYNDQYICNDLHNVIKSNVILMVIARYIWL
jgi:hypothetical protein